MIIEALYTMTSGNYVKYNLHNMNSNGHNNFSNNSLPGNYDPKNYICRATETKLDDPPIIMNFKCLTISKLFGKLLMFGFSVKFRNNIRSK